MKNNIKHLLNAIIVTIITIVVGVYITFKIGLFGHNPNDNDQVMRIQYDTGFVMDDQPRYIEVDVPRETYRELELLIHGEESENKYRIPETIDHNDALTCVLYIFENENTPNNKRWEVVHRVLELYIN